MNRLLPCFPIIIAAVAGCPPNVDLTTGGSTATDDDGTSPNDTEDDSGQATTNPLPGTTGTTGKPDSTSGGPDDTGNTDTTISTGDTTSKPETTSATGETAGETTNV